MRTWKAAWLILRKDLLTELRTREVVATMVLFAMLLVVVFYIAFGTDVNVLVKPGNGETRSMVFSG